MEAARAYETSVNFYRTTGRHIPEESTLLKLKNEENINMREGSSYPYFAVT
jgi:hypothetical protein